MRILLPVGFVFLFCFGSGLAEQNGAAGHQAGSVPNPCDKANTQMEMNQCSGDEYGKADAHLNAVYQELVAFLKKTLADTQKANDAQQKANAEAALQKLKSAEKAWMVYRDEHCSAAKQQYEGGSISPMVYANCMQLVTNHRIEELKAAYKTPDRKPN